MARYVLLRIDDEQEADDLLLDWHTNPRDPLLTPTQENRVHFDVVQGLTDAEWAVEHDAGFPEAVAIMHEVSDSYMRAGDLAVERDVCPNCSAPVRTGPFTDQDTNTVTVETVEDVTLPGSPITRTRLHNCAGPSDA